ncbi:membrane cofactor protein-like isoform X1 [Oreochromis aureus]|uniref:membrane cofactor protein-like isoform X1 n=1 Tax=Oreochromis aureus TaxID=47969 RepID=UPI0019542E4C|nr:membrane cofactor protein-like isoform X1 [Oreochromis aureus]
MAITAVLLLSSLGFFAVTAQDCSRPVGDNMDVKGNDIFLTSFPDGITVTFACNIGYESAGGSPSVTCTAGSWSPVGLKCQRKNCFSVEDVQDGQIEYHPGTEFGDKAVLICNPGHMPVGGGNLICGSQGWMGRLPVCEVTQCDSPPVVEYGSFSPVKELYDYNDVLQYTCKKDYTRNGSRQLICSDDGTFKPEPPKCIKVECGDPEIPFGQWSSGARPPYGYMSNVTLQCNTGYKMNGTATVMCGLNSQWLPGLPQCIPPHSTRALFGTF